MSRKETEGIVVEIKGAFALVKPMSHIGCESTFCCQGEGLSKVNIEMRNELNAVVGDKVIFEAREGDMLIAAFIVYLLPIILTFGGAVFGYRLSEILGINSTFAAIVGGVLLFIISIFIIRIADKYAAKNTSLKPVITKIV
jgi:sigma-E factor negative regulatory protein RseC